MDTGYDRYLKYQFRLLGSFFTALFDAISRADEDNLDALAKGFPEEVDAYKTWARVGSAQLVAKCSPAYQQKVESGEWVV